MRPRIHVVGAGLAGLAAAVRLSARPGVDVTLWEATGRAGGRCWSFHDRTLDRVIDNGNHLILSGNAHVLDHARAIGASGRLEIAPRAEIPFVDLASGERWCVRIPEGPLDLVRRGMGLPGPLARIAADFWRMWRAPAGASVAQSVGRDGPLPTRFWEPLSLAVLNEAPEDGSARLLASVLRQTVLRGAAASRPVFAPHGLGPALVDPAIDCLAERGAEVMWRQPLRAVDWQDGRVAALGFGDAAPLPLGPRDGVIVAAATDVPLFEGHATPRPGQTILNAHYRVQPEAAADLPPILGVISGAAQWIFRRDDVLSVTISAAEASGWAGTPREELLDRLWDDIRRAAGAPGMACLARRLVRARHATWDQSPAALAARSPEQVRGNLALAGDHTATDLPSSIEAAIRSGHRAADRMRDTLEIA